MQLQCTGVTYTSVSVAWSQPEPRQDRLPVKHFEIHCDGLLRLITESSTIRVALELRVAVD